MIQIPVLVYYLANIDTCSHFTCISKYYIWAKMFTSSFSVDYIQWLGENIEWSTVFEVRLYIFYKYNEIWNFIKIYIHICIYIYIYSRRLNDWRLVFFIILYPYFTHKGLIFILEVKFQSFLAEPTHMPDLSSE